jgi:hypothetical protein
MMCSFGFGDSVSLGDDVLGGDLPTLVVSRSRRTRAGSSVSEANGIQQKGSIWAVVVPARTGAGRSGGTAAGLRWT